MRVRVWYMYGLCTVSRDRRVRLPGASARFVGARAPGHAAHCRPINPGNTWARRRLGPIGAHAPKLLAGFCVEKAESHAQSVRNSAPTAALWACTLVFLALIPLPLFALEIWPEGGLWAGVTGAGRCARAE